VICRADKEIRINNRETEQANITTKSQGDRITVPVLTLRPTFPEKYPQKQQNISPQIERHKNKKGG